MGKLSAASIVERAIQIGDTEGIDAVTIRRLATDLGVTPMALYWHFKNKEQLLIGMADHLVANFAPKPADDRPWRLRLRELIEGLIHVLRAHPCARTVLEQIDKEDVPSYLAVWNEALGLTRAAGFADGESCLISKYLLQSAIAIADAPVHFRSGHTDEEIAEIVRVKRLSLESLPADTYPHLVRMADSMVNLPPGLYDSFGVDLILAGIESLAARRS
ncbi:TetR family transcriptional regulator [Nonomuraea glycinis]|uniref:TetR family transcriptional regulator n=1 Tax=Nonomuraea glycinis TaxID=2047744 RepID=A0A918E8X2_9ACTN|nr:TetR family transcriptional regulator [Nonomuraea glycinis]MCA2181099.1 TetR family transcriptional regulator [Nonomuraea glycinis]GGP13660.1 TetR family transcriptional regulator [Nonomuraea glycinis]